MNNGPALEKAVTEKKRGLEIIKLLWARFLKQRWEYKLITLVLLFIVCVWMVVFYSSFLIWQLFTFVMTKPLLWFIEWYLKKTTA
jgi:hypothetical protein